MSKVCEICGTLFIKRRPNSCQKCYFKKRHQERYKNKLRQCVSCGLISQMRHNIYCENCRDNIKTCDSNHRIYYGRKFYKNNLGYWVCTKSRMPWAHRWVWINHYGDIPKGHDVHHKDGDKDNNDVNNLEIMTRSQHQTLHWIQGDHDHEMNARKATLEKYRRKKSGKVIK